MSTWLLFGLFAFFLLAGVPIGIAVGLACVGVIFTMPFLNLDVLAQGLIASLNSFPLLAALLFTLAGNIMSQGGISRRLLRVAEVFFGRLPGGLGIVAIVACIFFATVSGTGSATVAAIGLMMIPSMAARGYDRNFAGALVAAAGGIGVIIPPSVVMVVYAITAETSITDMFSAGIIPGILIGLFLIGYCTWQSRRRGYLGDNKRYTFQQILAAVISSFWALLLPVIMLGGIYSGYFTPTESAAVGVFYSSVLAMAVYREISPRQFIKIVLESALLVGTVLVIIGTSYTFGRILTLERIPTRIASFILSITANKIFILLLINVLLLIVGTFMETLAAIVILTPILLPIVTTLGVSPVHFGIIMIVNLAIGFITPPLGANLFMAAQVGGLKIEELSRAIVGWVVTLIAALLLITYVPPLSLFLPGLFK